MALMPIPPIQRRRRLHTPSLIFLLLLAACRAGPTPRPATTTLVSRPTAGAASPSPGVPATPTTTTTPVPGSPTGTPDVPRELSVCLASEPASLYRYARPEPNRDHILAALYDGPIDSANFGFQPVLFEKLPSLADVDALLRTAQVVPGERVVDSLGRVVLLAKGVSLRLPDGSLLTYSGTLPASLPQMVVTFRMRPGLRWSDGAPLTAADSVFAFQIGRSPDAFDPQRDAADRTQSYRASDDATVTWTSVPGDLDPLYFTNFWPPLPSHQLASLTAAQIGASDEANRAPLSYGPFVLREWVPGQHLVVQRNPLYWRAGEGLPRLDRVTYIFAGGPDPLLAGLRSGTCDVAPSSAALDQASSALTAGAQAGDFKAFTVEGTTLEHLDFGLSPTAGYAPAAGAGVFQDVRVRQAFADCLDRAALSQGSQPPATYLPRAHPLYAADAAQHSFDPAQGRALLAAAGWTDTNRDGVLDKGGVALALTLAGGLAGDAHRLALMAAIQSQLQRNCGIGIKLKPLTRGELEGDWPDGVVFGRRFDLALFGWSVGALPPCALFTSAEIAGPDIPGGANDSGYSSPDFDAACAQAMLAFDPQVAAQRHAEAQRLFARDLPVLPLFFEPRRGAARPAVQGYSLDATSPSELWNIEQMVVLP